MSDNRGNRIRRVLDSKTQIPEYQRLGIEPNEGGKSLLHDEFGIPNSSPVPNKKEANSINDVYNQPIVIKASSPDLSTSQVSKGPPNRGRPAKSAEQFYQQDDDKFIPPKSNFVNVGNHEHTWYNEKVAGPKMIDNNDEIDIDSIQGRNPLSEIENEDMLELSQRFTQQLDAIRNNISFKLNKVSNLEELKYFNSSIFGQNGVFTKIINQFTNMNFQEKYVLGDLLDTYLNDIKCLLSSKEKDLQSQDENNPDEGYSSLPDERSDQDQSDSYDTGSEISINLEENQFSILVDDKPFTILLTEKSVRQVLTKLILGNNIDVERIKLIKRISIDFGVILGDD
jgi:hypothetical protein